MRYYEKNIGWFFYSFKEKNCVVHVVVKQHGEVLFDSDVKKFEDNTRELRVTTLQGKEFIFVKPLVDTSIF